MSAAYESPSISKDLPQNGSRGTSKAMLAAFESSSISKELPLSGSRG